MSTNSPSSNPASLKDILLKAAVIDFEKIFLDTHLVQGQVRRGLKKGIRLPPNLFEDIHRKGREIGWNVPAQFLKPCLPCRDALNWVNVSLLYGHYETEDLVEVGKSKLPLREFSFRSYRITQELFDVIQRFSPTLEILHIGRRITDDKKTDNEENHFDITFGQTKLRFPELRKLSINFNVLSSYALLNVDLCSCSNNLESLELNNFGFYCFFSAHIPNVESFVENIKVLKMLKSLCILLMNRKYDIFFENIHFLENLRSLTIMQFRSHYGQHDPFDCTILSYLENLSTNLILEKLPRVIKSTNLKYFGGVRIPDKELIESDKLAKIIGTNSDLDSLLTNFDYSLFNEEFSSTIAKEIIRKLNDLDINIVTKAQWRRLEKVILILIERYWTDIEHHMINYSKTIYYMANKALWTWSSDFLEKFVNLIVNFASYEQDMEGKSSLWIFEMMKSSHILSYMLNLKTKNPNTTAGNMILNYLLLRDSIANETKS